MHMSAVLMCEDDCENICGRINKTTIGQYESGTFMMKYGEIKISSAQLDKEPKCVCGD